jgi:hypothetical protein
MRLLRHGVPFNDILFNAFVLLAKKFFAEDITGRAINYEI